jgi:DNA transformation protein and related proteins
MAYDAGIVAWVMEALAPIGAVTLRPMMGAATLYCDGTVFAVVDDELWLKADAVSAPAWDEAGCERFRFTGADGVEQTMNYRRAPADCYDDPDVLRRWAALALEAGRRAPARKPRRKKP